MAKRILLFFLIIVLWSNPAKSQETVHIASLRVDIWPEFDRPSVLVIYHIYLVPTLPLPIVLTLHIPKQAVLNAVAVEDPSLGLLIAEYSQVDYGDWTELEIIATSYAIQVEYYDELIKIGTKRQVLFEWAGDAPVDAFSVVFQNPAGAENLKIYPTPDSSQRDQYNLLNYLSGTVALREGEVFKLTASYDKPNDELSIASLPVEPAISLEETGGQVAWSDVIPWVLGGLGIVLIALGLLILFGFTGKVGLRNKKEIIKQKRNSSYDATGITESARVYCKECGFRAEPGDQFCRSCGSHL